MLPTVRSKSQQGYIGLTVIAFLVALSLILYPWNPPKPEASKTPVSENYCRDLIDDPNAPTFEGPSYTADQIQFNNKRQYRLIKEKVPIYAAFYQETPNHEHFFRSYKEPYTDSSGQKFIVRIPKGDQGQSYPAKSELGDNYLQFAEYGLIYLFYSADGINPQIVGKVDLGPGATSGSNGIIDVAQVDIYKAVDLPALPQWVLKCNDTNLAPESQNSASTKGIVFPKQDVSPKKDQLQLEWFLFNDQDFQMRAWWVPHCKPAVYLYPQQKQLVNVKVFPKGELSYTDPPYDPEKGWTVWAQPSGQLQMPNTQFQISNVKSKYDYLYYESKLLDSEIKKPNVGWSVKGGEMGNFLERVLPQLGLNQKEKNDFENYWLQKLPKSPYYFVGLVDKPQRDYLETLSVTPTPDTSIRFSLFFEMKDEPVSVKEPVIQTPKRNGFTLVDWGGMVKLHPGTPFTCSQ